jgi:hypothetical protein
MSIDKIGSDFLRSLVPGQIRDGRERVEDDGAEERQNPQRGDRVELSAEGRALAARMHAGGDTISVGRAVELTGRIESGVYDDPSVAEEVARRIHDSGDLLGDA